MSPFRILLISLLLGSSAVLAQEIENKKLITPSLKLEFIPSASEPVFEIPVLSMSSSQKRNTVLTGAGWLLSGLKFRSVVDEFNAVPPFDYRGYRPKSFSSYSSHISNNYFLQNPITPLAYE